MTNLKPRFCHHSAGSSVYSQNQTLLRLVTKACVKSKIIKIGLFCWLFWRFLFFIISQHWFSKQNQKFSLRKRKNLLKEESCRPANKFENLIIGIIRSFVNILLIAHHFCSQKEKRYVQPKLDFFNHSILYLIQKKNTSQKSEFSHKFCDSSDFMTIIGCISVCKKKVRDYRTSYNNYSFLCAILR